MIWQCGRRRFDLSSRVLIMGILNVTPDSFSDGGRFLDAGTAVAHGEAMAAQGADIVDVGGESTRPGSGSVDAEEEIRRVVPVIEALSSRTDVAISIDTAKAEVARAALGAGAVIINDVTALGGDSEMAGVAASSGAGLVLMHMQGKPRTMQAAPHYDDVVGEIIQFLRDRETQALEQGILRDQIALDPGIGFGKTVEHNLEIFRRLADFRCLGRPLLVGASKKTFLRRLLGDGRQDEDVNSQSVAGATAASVAVSVLRGASIVRVHDVQAMRPLVRIAEAMR
ncbi:dihydropteroate synthase [Candidatus Sumerlaeota bacterium]|nr:dihydropteroate synthase [Candidatus Sumerlaeota bacterium]